MCEIISFCRLKQHKTHGNKLILFETAMTNNEVRWPGGNSFKQAHLIPMHASRHYSVTLALPTQDRCGFVDTVDKSQTSIQHNYQCDFMNIKENILFLRNE